MRYTFDITEADQSGPIFLGSVTAPKGMTFSEATRIIQESWSDFQDTQPDTDSDYIEYLEKFGFESAESHEQVMVGE